MIFLSTSWSTSFSPNPSISKADFDIKCLIRPLTCAGQDLFSHLAIASPSRRKTSSQHDGQIVGREYGSDLPFLFSLITLTISGITSPARWISTVSPILISLRSISS